MRSLFNPSLRSDARPRVLRAAAAAVALIVSHPGRANASCCGTGYGIGQRLAPSERAALLTSVRGSERYGAWNASGRYRTSDSSTRDEELRLELSGLVKLGSSLQVGALLPLVYNHEANGGDASSGAGVGDVSALARYDFVRVGGEVDVPGVALTLAVQAPTGRSPAHARDPLGSDVTGLGAWEVRPGVVVEHAWWTGWFVIGGASVGVRTAYVTDTGTRVALAPRWQLVGAGGRTWASGLGLALGGVVEGEVAPRIDGARADRASRLRTSTLVVGSYDVDASWSVVVSGQIELPVGGLGRNETTGVSVAFGVRRSWGISS